MSIFFSSSRFLFSRIDLDMGVDLVVKTFNEVGVPLTVVLALIREWSWNPSLIFCLPTHEKKQENKGGNKKQKENGDLSMEQEHGANGNSKNPQQKRRSRHTVDPQEMLIGITFFFHIRH